MKTKVVVTLDTLNNAIMDNQGQFIGTLCGDADTLPTIAETTLQLVKQGVSVEDIVKLKNSELI